jgi:hypothetical protein
MKIDKPIENMRKKNRGIKSNFVDNEEKIAVKFR